MLLSLITAEPDRFQFRDTAFSEQTVESIVASGVDLAKFDPIPIFLLRDPVHCVGGDGHSRLEALRRLREMNRMPEEWRAGGDCDWDVPHKLVTEETAHRLARTANISRDSFSPCEEARAMQSLLDEGLSIAQIVKQVHRSEAYVRKTLPLNVLCRDIRVMVGRHPDAGGVEKFVAQAMAERFQRHAIAPAQQSELWFKVLAHADLTVPFVRAFIDSIGEHVSKRSAEGLLFELPASVEHAVKAMKGRADNLRRAERGLAWLMQCLKEGQKDQSAEVLCEYPALREFLLGNGSGLLGEIKGQTAVDASLVGALCFVG